MFDTKKRNTSKLMVFIVTLAFMLSGVPVRFSERAEASRTRSGRVSKPGPGESRSFTVQSGPTYDKLLQDNSSGDQFRFNSTTGEYLFARCSNAYSLSGTGNLTVHGSTYTLTHYPGDRRITVKLDDALHKGTASVQVFALGITYTITDSNTTNDPGLTDAEAPQVGITAPNGGEIIDTASSFTISWNTADNVGVVSQDLLLSTDGGTNWSSITSGLAGSVDQYVWTVPAMINQQAVRVRVIARDAACNANIDDSDANVTIWNPPASFTHSAEAPLFFAGQGFTSTIFMTNTSSSALVVELDPHQPDGNATQNFPFQTLLNAGASATVDAASLYTIGESPENPDVPDMIDGGIRLRHNGSQDTDVRAIIVVERDCSEEFTTPFTYASSSLSASGTMQCSPMYYVDDDTDAFVAFQNVTDSEQIVQFTCHYGTGIDGTPNGEFKNQPITLGPQKTQVVNLRSVLSAFDGAEWGSMTVFTSNPQSVVCHSVMRSGEKGISWDCPFVDPAMCTNTTKVAQAIRLDRADNNENAYLMVCNMSASTRTVTASFNTTSGIALAPVQVTIASGAQQMITVAAPENLKPGISIVADVRLTYEGSPSDIVAAGCSMTANEDRAIAVKFKEASVNDGRRLTSPYFRFDEYISGSILVSNLGSSSIKVGARMVLANSTVKPLKTPAVTIPAGEMATIDLSSVGDSVPDNVIATGSVDLIHSGAAGTVTAAVTASGCYNSSQVVPLDGGVPLDPVTLFPIGAVVIPGGCTEAEAITDGTVNPEITSPGACFGTLIQTFASGPNTFQTTMCVPTNCVGDISLAYVPPGGGAGDESDFTVVQTSAAGFSTSLGTRLNPNGTTQFTLSATDPFPNALLQVEFTGGGTSVSTQAQGNGVSASISGNGPVNHTFLGKVKKIFVTQLNPDGTPNTSVPRVLKAKNTGAYFALDKPTSLTSVAPNAVPVTGATVTITGNGFHTWTLGSGFNEITVNPVVLVGKANRHDQIPFTVISVSPNFTSLTGNVRRTPNEIGTCAEAGETPCKTITVINPGGSDGVDNLTSENLLTINNPSPPVITGTASLSAANQVGPATSNSIGGSGFKVVNGFSAPISVTAKISGRNLSRVDSVTFVGADPIAIGPSNIKSDGEIQVGVPAICITGAGGSNTVAVLVDDGVNTPVSFANGWIYMATGPVQVVLPGIPINKIAYLVGPCEMVSVSIFTFPDGSLQVDSCQSGIQACVKIPTTQTGQHGFTSAVFPNANIALFGWTTECAGCTPPGTYTGFFVAVAQNDKAPSNTVTACFSTSCTSH